MCVTPSIRILPSVAIVMVCSSGPIMSQPIGPRGGPLLSLPGFVGPGPKWHRDSGPGVGWNYYGLPSGPSTSFTDYRVGIWNWGWRGAPASHRLTSSALNLYGPPSPSYTPIPSIVGGGEPHRLFVNPPVIGYGLSGLGYRAASPRLYSTSVSVRPSSAVSPPSPGCCRLDVRLPVADAELWINESKTAANGVERQFQSPELSEGKEFRYELVAHWLQSGKQQTAKKSVVVAGGRSVLVDFTTER